MNDPRLKTWSELLDTNVELSMRVQDLERELAEYKAKGTAHIHLLARNNDELRGQLEAIGLIDPEMQRIERQYQQNVADAGGGEWPFCVIEGCANRCCRALDSVYCWPHTQHLATRALKKRHPAAEGPDYCEPAESPDHAGFGRDTSGEPK